MNYPEPLPYNGKPFYKPKKGKVFQEAMYAFLFNPKRVFLSVTPADLSFNPQTCYMFADCDAIPLKYGTDSKEDLMEALPGQTNAAPLIIWEDDLAKTLPNKIQVIPLRRIFNDYLNEDYSNWHSPTLFYDHVLLGWNHLNLPSPVWPDLFPKKKEDYEYKRLLTDCAVMEQMLRLIAESYYKINLDDF